MQHSIRVYGLLINADNEILISDEKQYGMQFSKFPGGGLEYGEGTIDGLKREFVEECNAEIEVVDHFYTTDFFIKSAFSDAQIISIYYTVKNIHALQLNFKNKPFDFDSEGDVLQAFRWLKVSELKVEDVTFPIDQHVVKLLKQQYGFS
ncbi:NUDIX domain-containing protein [Mucilaginibacter auburnensis]|uniref:NUDIX domain-containing protein n=1 Tax=Mucilaginibacter auburnensis TaxID=1457233 RepID=A0A2H9VVU7_9SPHI|nr:NUDIX domain-containing protein [Mucilaginibacter auburnensis]PJJ84937.1 NUDIX domain-containing protein [Mucilaginibacter auburnensis]